MDERALFDRFHEALDIEPRPGAFERLQTEITKRPVALPRRPVFRMRFTQMGFRTAAALVAVLIVIALIATFVAVHNRPVGGIPATDPNVKAFRALIVADYAAFNASTSNHCGSIDDAGCAAALETVMASLQKWADDINAFPKIPAQYRAIGVALRAHLLDVVKDGNAVIAFQKAGDAAGFDFGMRGAFYQRAWIDPATLVIEGDYPGAARSYSQAVATAKRAVLGCVGTTPGPDVLACNRLQDRESCAGGQKLACEGDVESAQTLIEQSLVDTAQNPASNADYARLQQDLATADAGLLAIHDALIGGGGGDDVNNAEMAFYRGMVGADNDLGTL